MGPEQPRAAQSTCLPTTEQRSSVEVESEPPFQRICGDGNKGETARNNTGLWGQYEVGKEVVNAN